MGKRQSNRKTTEQPTRPSEPTKKQVAMSRRERKLNRRVLIFGSIALAIALAIVAVGAVHQLVVLPRQPVAVVEGEPIRTGEYQKRVRFQHQQILGQITQLHQLEVQLGGGGFFQNQINQLEMMLRSPDTLGIEVLNQMIDERVIRLAAAERGITVTQPEIEEELLAQIAAFQGGLTEPAATATAEVHTELTATAAEWTPTPTLAPTETPTPTVLLEDEVDLEEEVDAIDPLVPVDEEADVIEPPLPIDEEPLTPEPTPTPQVFTEVELREAEREFAQVVAEGSGLSLEEYRRIIEVQLLREKLRETIVAEMPTTEEQMHARHILIQINEPLAEGIEPREGEVFRSEEEAQELAQDVYRQLLEGADFAELAMQVSDDPGSGAQGGDLGWFGRGRMVPEFEQAAFSLEVGEISEPVRSDFGYHIIEVLERDESRELPPHEIEQRQDQAWQEFLADYRATLEIERNWTADLVPSLSPPPAQRGL